MACRPLRERDPSFSVLSQKFVEKIPLMCAPFSKHRQGRHNLAQGESPGDNVPYPLLFPLPRSAGEGVGGRGRTRDPRLAPWAKFLRPLRGLIASMNL